MAIAAIVVVLVLVGGVVVALVVLGGDDDPDPSERSTTTEPGESSGSSTSDTADGPTTTTASGSSLPGPSVSGDTGSTTAPSNPTTTLDTGGVGAPPADLPRPPGATDNPLGIGLDVPGMTVDEVVSFYEDALPGAGYTVESSTTAGSTGALTVSGPASGTLAITSLIGTTTVTWVPG